MCSFTGATETAGSAPAAFHAHCTIREASTVAEHGSVLQPPACPFLLPFFACSGGGGEASTLTQREEAIETLQACAPVKPTGHVS